MKRHPGLQKFSREHHAALVLAKRAQRLGGGAAEAAVRFAAEAAQACSTELEPHFSAEEDGLLPALAAAGETALVNRTLADHEALRALACRLAAGDVAGLRRFGELLAAHVRFEERELYPRAESTLPAEALADIDRAARTRPSDGPAALSDGDPPCAPARSFPPPKLMQKGVSQ